MPTAYVQVFSNGNEAQSDKVINSYLGESFIPLPIRYGYEMESFYPGLIVVQGHYETQCVEIPVNQNKSYKNKMLFFNELL